MHRHGYKGRKLGRERDQRRALIKGLASSLALNEQITTTVPKAKELVPYFEKLITKAKKGNLHSRRQVISKMANVNSAHKLVDEIAPKLGGRNSGHLKIEKAGNRRGDNAEMAKVSFVDDLKISAQTEKNLDNDKDEPKIVAKQTARKTTPKKSSIAAKQVKTSKSPTKASSVKKEKR